MRWAWFCFGVVFFWREKEMEYEDKKLWASTR